MIFTIGHSNHSLTNFLSLLALHEITALVDVRSNPASSYTPHFSRTELEPNLTEGGISYVFLGNQLGGRTTNPGCYVKGRLQYAMLAREPAFESGIVRLKVGANQFRLALMCSEKDPLRCHRSLLVARRLHQDNIHVDHILASGKLESHRELENRLLALCGLSEIDMFRSRQEGIDDAYKIQGGRVAYADETMLDEHEHS